MSGSNSKPDVEQIVAELREGMRDAAPPAEFHPETGPRKKLKSSLRKASETADVLGRSGGSLRGKVCKLLAWFGLPVVEQLNLHHKAVVDALNQLHAYQKDELERRIADLENSLNTPQSSVRNSITAKTEHPTSNVQHRTSNEKNNA